MSHLWIAKKDTTVHNQETKIWVQEGCSWGHIYTHTYRIG